MVGKLFIIHIKIMLWILIMLIPQAASSSEAKPNCQDSCGSVSIPYPFGIGRGCYYEKWFEIDCRGIKGTEQQHARPYLKTVNLEVLDVSVNYGGVTVLHPVNGGTDLRGTPFSFSRENNVFVGFGCDIIAYMTDQYDKDVLAWCVSACNSKSDQPGKCQTRLKHNFQTLGHVGVQSASGKRVASNCTVGDMRANNVTCGFGFFAVQFWEGYTNSDSEIFSTGYVPVSLVWDFYDEKRSSLLADNTTILCEKNPSWYRVNRSFYNMSSFVCTCRYGYYGNPYIPNGCPAVAPRSNPYNERKKFNWKLVVIGVISAMGALFLVFLVWWLHKKVKTEINRRKKERYFKRNGGLLLKQQISSNDGNIDKTKVFSSYELEKATDNYNVDRVLGQGGQGTVYKGMLSDGKIIAVKKSKFIDTTKVGQFINEVVILSQINHRNVVRLLGCCLETEVPLLVYEFISNGTLFQHIHDPNEDFPLTWDMRVRIAVEVAGALSYMHSSASLPIYHRDIKSTNILLDEKYKAIVSDFGTSRSVDVDKTHFTTLVQGTFGYLDPEYFQSSQFTEKSDVYSFGVVLVELLTGKKPIFSNTSQEFRGLAPHFLESMEQNQFLEMIDPQISKEGKIEEMTVVAHLAKMCLNLKGKERPTMKEVVVQLEVIKMLRENDAAQGYSGIIDNNSIDLAKAYDTSSATTETWSETSTALSQEVCPLYTYP